MDSERLRRLMFRPQMMAFATPTVKAKAPKLVTTPTADRTDKVYTSDCGCTVTLFAPLYRSNRASRCAKHADTITHDELVAHARRVVAIV